MGRRLWNVATMLAIMVLPACSGDATPTASQPSTEPSPSIESALPELSAFVEQVRGRQFREEVKVRVLPEPLFTQELEKLAADPEDVARRERVLAIFGLLPPEADLAALVAAFDKPSVAFYDPASGELVSVNNLTPYVRSVLVHELTHALDDQHFQVARQIPGDDAAAAFQALVEGSAIRVEHLYVRSLPEDEQRQIATERERIRAARQLPVAVEQLLGLPKAFGPSFVEVLLEEGPERLDQAFSSPPTTFAHILEPARYLAGDSPQEVGSPHTEGAVIDQGEIGPAVLGMLLEQKLDLSVVEEAVEAWDGDRYATWRSPDGRTCIRVRFAVDAPEDALRLEGALAEWVSQVTDREVDSAGLLLKACGLPSEPGRAQASEEP